MSQHYIKKIGYLLYCYLEGLCPELELKFFKLYKSIKNCQKCELSKTRKNIVIGEGPVPSKIMIIGEAPGYYEDIEGKPFVGNAGQLLTKMLKAINIQRDTVYITNIIKCHPPQNRNPLPSEIENCFPFLEQQMEIINPQIILTLGNFAIQALLNTPDGITRLRGKIYYFKNIPVIPTYHPAALLRNENLKKPAWEDLKLFRKTLQEIEK